MNKSNEDDINTNANTIFAHTVLQTPPFPPNKNVVHEILTAVQLTVQYFQIWRILTSIYSHRGGADLERMSLEFWISQNFCEVNLFLFAHIA